MKPQPTILAALRAAAHKDVDSLFDSWPYVTDEANAHFETNARRIARQGSYFNENTDGDKIRSRGEHSDPTPRAALRPNYARQWGKQASHLFIQLHKLAAQVDTIIGPAVCPECTEPLADKRTRLVNGIRYHDGACHMRAYRRVRNIPAGQSAYDGEELEAA